jgi:putative methyltransferase (TIGR04325 family)
MNIRDLVPPIFSKLKLRTRTPLEDEGIFDSYAEALAACGESIFSVDEYARVIVYKTKKFRDNPVSQGSPSLDHSECLVLSGALAAIQRGRNKTLRVLDVGGASGIQYFMLKQLISDLAGEVLKLHWHVVETEATVRASKELENSELRFFPDIASAKKELKEVDLIHMSSTLQCLPDPEKSLDEIIQCGAGLVYLGRIGLTPGRKKFIALHQANFEKAGPSRLLPKGAQNVFYKVPFTFLTEAEFFKSLRKEYQIEVQIQDRAGIFPVPGKELAGYSILARRR